MDNPWAENWAHTQTEQHPDPVESQSTTSVQPWTSPTAENVIDQPSAPPSSWATTDDDAWGLSEAPSGSAGWKEAAFEPTTWQPAAGTLDDLPVAIGVTAVEPNSESSGKIIPSPPDSPAPRPIVALSEDIDGFGSFETGESEETEDTWVPGNTFVHQEDEHWGNGSWKESGEEMRDEWEVAKQEQAIQDRHVPPERLNAILEEFRAIASELWPGITQESTQSGPVELETVISDSARQVLIPEGLTLPMAKPFPQTFMAKREAETLKLTRNDAVTRKGPMSMFMSSRGSTSWEASVKPEVDVSPVGWKIVPKEGQDVNTKRTSAIATGGIMSFFSRRSNSPKPPVDSPKTASPIHSRTASVDNLSIASTPATVAPPAPLDFFPEASQELKEPEQAPSAVSRFFGRFSRNSQATRQESLALSTDDLEFLSDVVPTANEAASEDDQLKALSNMIKSPASITPLPKPLAPPPRASQPKRQTSLLNSSSFPANTSLAKSQTPPIQDDLFSIFDSPAASTATAPRSNKQSHPLPSIPLSDSLHLSFSPPTYSTSDSSLSFTSSIGSPSSTIFSVDSKVSLPALGLSPSLASATGSLAAAASTIDLGASLNTPPLLPPKPSNMTAGFAISRPSSQASTLGLNSLHRSMQSLPPSLSSFPPPPGSRPQTPSTTPSYTSQPPPPAFSLPPSKTQSSTSMAPTTSFQDDDFDDFVTSPSVINSGPQPSTSFGLGDWGVPLATQNQPKKVTGDPIPSKSSTLVDDWGDFSALTTPSTPAVKIPMIPLHQVARQLSASTSSKGSHRGSPTSSPHIGQTMSVSPGARSISSASSRSSVSSSPKVSKAEHQRTMSLLETAASRGNTWLDPPSPLPVALPGPPSGASHKPKDPFEELEGGVFSTQQNRLAPPIQAPNTAFARPSSRSSASPTPPPSRPITNRTATPPITWTFPPSSSSGGASGSGNRTSFAIPPPPASARASPAPAPISSTTSGQTKSNSLNLFMLPPPHVPAKGTSSPARVVSPPIVPLKPAPSASQSKGGLSAQDLAFFEGL